MQLLYDKVRASGLVDAEIARRGGSALNRRWQQIGPPSKTHRSLRTNATRRRRRRERRRVLLIADYEALARKYEEDAYWLRYTRPEPTRRMRIRNLRGSSNISATPRVPTIALEVASFPRRRRSHTAR